MQAVTQLRIKATPVYFANKKAYDAGFPVICNEGGSRSSKSYSIVQLLIRIANSTKTRISIVSHSLPHIKRGVYRDFRTVMEAWQLWDDNCFSFTDFIYTFPQTGSYIELFGLEDEGKARGPGRDILFINEANLIHKSLYDQLAMRTTGQIFLDWNPADFTSWVYKVADDINNKRIHSTYRNNLSNLSKNQINTIEAYKHLPDDFMWKVYGLGERGASKELIYTAWKLCDELPGKGEVIYGLDFGFTAPCALVKVEIYDNSIFVQEKLYQSGLTISDLAIVLKNLAVGDALIYADTAEPKSIEELTRYGFVVLPSVKDVWAGILKVKSMPLFVTKDSTNLINEITGYKWKVDKDGNIMEEPVKLNDHLLDAKRYAVHTHTTTPQPIYAVI